MKLMSSSPLTSIYPQPFAIERARALAQLFRGYDVSRYGGLWDEAVQLVGARRSLMRYGVSDLDIEVATLEALRELAKSLPSRIQTFTALLAFGVPVDLLDRRAA